VSDESSTVRTVWCKSEGVRQVHVAAGSWWTAMQLKVQPYTCECDVQPAARVQCCWTHAVVCCVPRGL